MKILVGVKLVPVASEVRFVAGLNRLDREAVRSEMNAFDGRALAWARALRRGGEGRPGGDRPDQVVAFTM
ncbi:MAG: hypothetical protein ACRDWN_03540, partial [Acidimicrobiales bacterium]